MVLHHPTLGPLLGLSIPATKTTQYRNLQYATIESRFSDPILYSPPSPPPTKELDATKFGPSCPQHPACFKYDLNLVGVSPELEREMERRVNEEGAGVHDEFGCANLVVVVPEGVKKDELLPVMVWCGAWVMFSFNAGRVEFLTMASGGFSGGSNSWPHYDLSKFVQTSMEIGKPIIGVSINYRLGPFGYLVSSPVVAAKGNYGLKDQACAFQWIKTHISGFGGHPDSITAFGESAGSICLTTHLHTQPSTPPFNRLIAISGDPTLRRPNSMIQQKMAAFHMRHKFLHTESLPSVKKDEKVFQTLPAEDLVMKLPPFGAWAPTIDRAYIKDDITIEQIADEGWTTGKPEWCEKVLIGDALGDATVLHDRLLHLPSERLISRLWKCLEVTFPQRETLNWTDLSTRIFRAYNLPINNGEEKRKSRKEVYDGMLELMSDLRFHMPSVAMQKGWGERVDRYVWGVPNPHPNSKFSGYPSHELEIAYLFQNFPLPSAAPSSENIQPLTPTQIGKQLASAFINFAYGLDYTSSIPLHSSIPIGNAHSSSNTSALQRLEAVKAHLEPPKENNSEADNHSEIIYITSSQGVTRIPVKTWDSVYNHSRVELWNSIPVDKWYLLGDRMQNSAY